LQDHTPQVFFAKLIVEPYQWPTIDTPQTNRQWWLSWLHGGVSTIILTRLALKLSYKKALLVPTKKLFPHAANSARHQLRPHATNFAFVFKHKELFMYT
jgi:hypothetical protein